MMTMSNDDSLVTPSSCFKRALLLLGLMRERLKNSVEKCELNFFSDKIEENENLSSFLF